MLGLVVVLAGREESRGLLGLSGLFEGLLEVTEEGVEPRGDRGRTETAGVR